jgi:hypothetical protein
MNRWVRGCYTEVPKRSERKFLSFPAGLRKILEFSGLCGNAMASTVGVIHTDQRPEMTQ